jgi:hypothetical protein
MILKQKSVEKNHELDLQKRVASGSINPATARSPQ